MHDTNIKRTTGASMNVPAIPRNTMKLRQKVITGQVVNCKVERAGEGA